MIFFNGASDPDGVSYNGTSLDNVYFNNTLVWTRDKSETGGSGSGTSGISGGGYAVDVPESSFEGQTGKQPAPSSISGTVRFNYAPTRAASFNDLTKTTDTIYCDTNMSVIGSGAIYSGTISTELVFNASTYSTVTSDGVFYIFDSGTKYDAAYTSWTGLPSGMSELPDEYRTISPIENVTVTCNAKLRGGGTATRVYTGNLIFGRGNANTIIIACTARGDESEVAPATSGYVVQETAAVHLMFSQ